MISLLDLLFGTPARKPVFAEDESAERLMRIAELKWLLREIAEDRDADVIAPDNDNRAPRRRGEVA
jgi:hypothetical protein